MRVFLAVLIIGIAAGGAAQAQELAFANLAVELTPMWGYLAGGAVHVDDGELRTSSASNWGVLLDLPMYRFRGAQLEASYVKQSSEMYLRGSSGLQGDQKLFDVDTEFWHLGILQEFEYDGRLRPFALISLGATAVKPQGVDVSDEWRFSMIVGGGAKYMFADHLGIRFDGRLYTTFISSSASFLCGGSHGCFVTVGSEVVFQANGNLGLIVAF